MKKRLFLIFICLTLALSSLCFFACNDENTGKNVDTQRAVEERKDEKPFDTKQGDEFFKHHLHKKRPPKRCPECPNFDKNDNEKSSQ